MFALRGVLNSRITAQLERIREEAGLQSLSELAYRFSRHQTGTNVVLTGTGDPDHLKQNIAAALSPPLSADVLGRLRALGG